jgi:hypothetical protein
MSNAVRREAQYVETIQNEKGPQDDGRFVAFP